MKASNATTGTQPTAVLNDHDVRERIEALRPTDNCSNWLYLARAYAIITTAVTFAIWFHQWRTAQGLSVGWEGPVFLLAVIMIGASQHQLAGATHEATHHLLFRHLLLNELVSDWLCMFPLFSSTYIFRQHHLAHHQFINDPERDPDFSQLRQSGHDLDFPVSPAGFAWMLLRQLTLYPLVKYILVRARYNSLGGVANHPYAEKERSFSVWPIRFAIGYLVVLFGGMIWATRFAASTWLAVLPAAGFLGIAGVLLAVPRDRYPVSRLRPLFSARAVLISRVAHATLLGAAIAWTQRLTGAPAWIYFFLLWIVPLFTSFSFFMILRQLIQHGNGDRGRLTNTRVFHVNPLLRYAVFPFGMDYHLPHHLHANVPHYRLHQLHALLLQSAEYREKGTVVDGYFLPRDPRRPTVVEVLGPAHAKRGAEVFIDESVLEEPRAGAQESRQA
ncbi:MAG: hypothetical protein QOE70_3738 [Chthoniobacter sp.]|jgi:fatty acid desaturase|nr:hypothetical protein [Chthoniobacter sp.]